MRTVLIFKPWRGKELLRQSPGHSGIWGDHFFTLEFRPECDYVLVINHMPRDMVVRCPPGHVLAIMHEPPHPGRRRMHRGSLVFARIYTQDLRLRGRRYVHSQPAITWMVGRDYDFLVGCPPPDKERDLSWITSNKSQLAGHRERLAFMQRVAGKVPFDLYGSGFTPLGDKWDGLAPYRYSLAIENFSNPCYWSEKLADCLLSWTMPIYYGCTRITDYFPPEALVQIDIRDAEAVEKVREAVASDRWKQNLDAIAYARKLILDKYQLFPFMAGEIEAIEAQTGVRPPAEEILLSRHSGLRHELRRRIGHMARGLNQRLFGKA